MRPSITTRRGLGRAAVSAAVALTAVGTFSTSAFAVTPTPTPTPTVTPQTAMTLSSASGAITGGNTLTLTLGSTATPKFGSGSVGVQFQATTALLAATARCSTNPATATQVTAATVQFISTTKVAVRIPDLTSVTSTNNVVVCAYTAAAATGTIPTTATVVGRANYLAATAPTLVTGAVEPATGPAVGGQVITVTGTGFPTSVTASTPLTANLGGVALTGITPISATSFTAVTPAGTPSGAITLSVTTNGGSVSQAAAYAYKNGVSVSPNTVPSGSSVDVDMQGTGFNGIDFSTTTGSTSENTKGHVYLVSGVYSGAGYLPAESVASAGDAALKTTGEATECVNVAVISDTELICTVDATHKIVGAVAGGGATAGYTYTAADLAVGTYTATVVSSGLAATPGYQTVLSSGATFTVADF
jgi:hypothetical protein